ncbi:SET domain-containing protein [Agrocybe pediades]|nr:SET domain-containing protein [Agrocybe pediades]KAF9546666.1 SET domain-containing protein [Agrocybe pediades]
MSTSRYSPESLAHRYLECLGKKVVSTPLPLRLAGAPSDPDGNSIFAGQANTAKRILDTPGFPQPVPKPAGGAPTCEVRQTKNMGLGVFATRVINEGELVLAERPLLVAPTFTLRLNNSFVAGQITSDNIFSVAEETVAYFKAAVERMEPDRKEQYLSLTVEKDVGEYHREMSILRNNAHNTHVIFDGEKETPLSVYGAVSKIGSRINHSCRPNVVQEFDLKSFSLTFRAVRRIGCGEQIFVNYVSLILPAAERRANLARYDMVCKCLACIKAPQSDKIRTGIEQRMKDLLDLAEKAKQQNALGRQHLDLFAKVLQDMVDEGMQAHSTYNSWLEHVKEMANDVGAKKMAERFKKECARRTKSF